MGRNPKDARQGSADAALDPNDPQFRPVGDIRDVKEAFVPFGLATDEDDTWDIVERRIQRAARIYLYQRHTVRSRRVPRPKHVVSELNAVKAAAEALADALRDLSPIALDWLIAHNTHFPIFLAARPDRPAPAQVAPEFLDLRDKLFAPEFEVHATMVAAWKEELVKVAAAGAASVEAAVRAVNEADETSPAGSAKPDRAFRYYAAKRWEFEVEHVHPSPRFFGAAASARVRGWARLAEMARENLTQSFGTPLDRGNKGPMTDRNPAENLAIRCLETILMVCGQDAVADLVTSAKGGDFDLLLKAVAYGYALGWETSIEHRPDEFSGVREQIVSWRDRALTDPNLGREPW